MRPPPDAAAQRTRAAETAVELALAGDLDMVATFNLEPKVDRLLAETGVRRLILNFADVSFIDSAGVGAIVSIRERTEQLGVELILADVPGPVHRVLEIAGTTGRGDASPARDESAAKVCPACGGNGRQGGAECRECGGTGRVEEAVGGG
jgi:anti-anti-sigma factor